MGRLRWWCSCIFLTVLLTVQNPTMDNFLLERNTFEVNINIEKKTAYACWWTRTLAGLRGAGDEVQRPPRHLWTFQCVIYAFRCKQFNIRGGGLTGRTCDYWRLPNPILNRSDTRDSTTQNGSERPSTTFDGHPRRLSTTHRRQQAPIITSLGFEYPPPRSFFLFFPFFFCVSIWGRCQRVSS